MTIVKHLHVSRITDKRQTDAPVNKSRTGYGSKIPTTWLLRLDGKRWYRVYCVMWSNSGSWYVKSKGESLFLGSYDPRDA